MLVAGQGELLAQAVQIEPVALLEEEGVADEKGGRRHAGDGRGSGDDQDIALAAGDGIEGRQAFGDQILVGREAVVGQRLPIGQMPDTQCRGEPGDFLDQALAIERLGDHDQQEVLARCQLGDQQGVGRAAALG